jgi:hypothetical protein
MCYYLPTLAHPSLLSDSFLATSSFAILACGTTGLLPQPFLEFSSSLWVPQRKLILLQLSPTLPTLYFPLLLSDHSSTTSQWEKKKICLKGQASGGYPHLYGIYYTILDPFQSLNAGQCIGQSLFRGASVLCFIFDLSMETVMTILVDSLSLCGPPKNLCLLHSETTQHQCSSLHLTSAPLPHSCPQTSSPPQRPHSLLRLILICFLIQVVF